MADDPPTRRSPESGGSSADPSSLKGLTMALGIEPAKPGEDSLLGCDIGGVTIIRLIAEGGMGRVYEGKQEKPNRTVAVKVMRPGLTSPSILKRFEYEAEVLGRLQHPGIAHIYSVGVHRMGNATVPYFVMEYIADARTLTQYADDLKLPTRQRLDLFRSVCEAVAHGHQKGVIHRDLKPSNILVDATGQPKVIDFGVARATDADMALTTMQTDVGQLIGTLQYMSPEQFDADPNDIDIRSDVYALGVILYELLAGKMPYDVKKKAIYEVMRIVKEEEPTPLSSLNRALKGDVAVIAGKCLEKERGRRYSSASELGSDVGRYLAGDAISASAPSFVDGLVRLARKHRAAAAATAVVLMALVVAVCGITYFYIRAEDQRAFAVASENAAKSDRDRMQRVLGILQEAFSAPDPAKIGREVTVANVLTRFSQTTADRFDGDPITEAEVLATIGATLLSLGLYDDADTATTRAVALTESPGADSHPRVTQLRAQSMSTLAGIRLYQERLPEAVELYSEAIRLAEVAMPADILFRVRNLNAKSHAYLRNGFPEVAGQVLDKADELIRMHGHEKTLEAIETQQYRCMMLAEQNRHLHTEESRRLTEDAIEKSRRLLGREHRKTAELLSDLAVAYRHDKRYEEAERLLTEALAIDEQILGPEHWDTAKVWANLGVLYRNMGRLDDAEQALKRSLSILERQFGLDYAGRVAHLMNLGVVKACKQQPEEAAILYRKALAMTQKTNPCDPKIQVILDNIFVGLSDRGDTAQMARDLADAWTLASRSCGNADPVASRFLDQLYTLAVVLRMPTLAIPILREAIKSQTGGSELVEQQRILRQMQLARLLCLVPNATEAEVLARELIDALRAAPDHEMELRLAQCVRAEALCMLGQSNEAARLLQEVVAVMGQHPDGQGILMLRATQLQAVAADVLFGPARASTLYESVIEIAEKLTPATVPDSPHCSRPSCPKCAGRTLVSMVTSQASARLNAMGETSSRPLVQQAENYIESRHYLLAEAVLRQAVSTEDAEEFGASTALDNLMQLLGRPGSELREKNPAQPADPR